VINDNRRVQKWTRLFRTYRQTTKEHDRTMTDPTTGPDNAATTPKIGTTADPMTGMVSGHVAVDNDTVTIEVGPDDGRDSGVFDTGATRTADHSRWTDIRTARVTDPKPARRGARGRAEARDGGTLHVITAAARTPAVGLVASYEGADDNTGEPPGGLRDGMAIRVVSRLDRHEVPVPGATIGDGAADGSGAITNERPLTVTLRHLPAAALTNPRCSLGVVLPDDWNAMIGAGGGYSANGLEYEVNALEVLGFKIRHRLYVHASPSTLAVHFGGLAERFDLRPVARDILRAGGTVQVEAGAMTALDAVAAAGIPPWAGWVARFDMTIVVPCVVETQYPATLVRETDAGLVAALASDAVRAAGGPVLADRSNPGIALVDAHKVVPGIAGWTTEQFHDPRGDDPGGVGAANELEVLYVAVRDACDGEVDVELVGTGPTTLIDLR
jgi:hypothetical protein